MKVTDVLGKDSIIEDLKSKTQKDVLAELSAIFLQGRVKFHHDALVNTLLEREKLGSTGIGDGIAIPHGKHSDFDEVIVSFGRSRAGVEFNAMDGKPAHLFFLLVAPESATGQHLKVLAKISKMLKDSKFRGNLIHAKSKEDLYELISERDDACS
jgi:PTS system nitrogen regulatory IIA component